MQNTGVMDLFISQSVDYSPWERKERNDHAKATKARPRRSVLSPTSTPLKSPPLKCPVNNIENSFGKECSKLCRHGPKAIVVIPKCEIQMSKDRANIAMLKYQVEKKKTTLNFYNKERQTLMLSNMRLKSEIESYEMEMYSKVNETVSKYHRYSAASSAIKNRHVCDLLKVETDKLEAMQLKANTEIESLGKQVELLEANIQLCRSSLKELLNYKGKGHPESVEELESLRDEFQHTRHGCVEEYRRLNHVASVARRTYHSNVDTRDRMLAQIADGVYRRMDESVKEMARSNYFMRKEVEWHQLEENVLKKDIEILRKNIRYLRKTEFEQYARLKHPERYSQKFSPRSQLQLRVPVHKTFNL